MSIVVPDGVVFREIDGEAVVLNLATGQYFGLDRVGTRMWRALVDRRTVPAACLSLLAVFDVERDRLERDLGELVETLVDKGLLALLGAGVRAEE